MPRKAAPAAPLATTPAAAIASGGLLADAFHGPSWGRWTAVLKAAWGEPLDAAELALFQEIADRDPPTRPVKELWAIVGRGGGKDSVASAIAATAALRDYRGKLRPGEKASILCLAATRDQAGIVHGYISGYFRESELLKTLVERETDEELVLRNGTEIIVATNNFRAIRGRTVVCAILDEVAFWRSEDSAAPDVETYTALVPSLARVPGSMLIGISTPYARRGLLFDKWRQSYGQPDPDVLVVRGATRLFNETIPQSVIDADLARDPEAQAAEWLAEWRSDLSDFLDKELIEAAVDSGVPVRPPVPGVSYGMFADASGGRGSSFTAAVAHSDEGMVILDCVYERRAPFNPSDVMPEVAGLARSYDIATCVGDNFAPGWVADGFSQVGIRYQRSERDRSAIYLDALPLFTSGRARLVDNARMVRQFSELERRTTRFGRDRVGHPERKGGGDDVANAAAGALVLVASDARPTLIRLPDLLLNNAPVPMPRWCTVLRAVVVVSVNGQAGVVFMAPQGFGRRDTNIAILVDFEVGPLRADLYDRVMTRALALFDGMHRASDAVVYVQREMRELLAQRQYPCDVIKPEWLADPEGLALSAAGYVNAGRVKIAAPAWEKSRTTPLAGALVFQPGTVADDPLRLAWLVAVKLAMED